MVVNVATPLALSVLVPKFVLPAAYDWTRGADEALRAAGLDSLSDTPEAEQLLRAHEAANSFDPTGRKEGIKQFLDDKTYKPGLGAYDKSRQGPKE